MVLDRRFGFLSRDSVNVGELTPEQIHAREVRRVPFLVRKLIDDLEGGEKLFLFHGMTKLTARQAVRRYGSGKLLRVKRATRGHRPGNLEQLEDGLYKSYKNSLVLGENAHDLSLACWIALCEAAVASNTDLPP